MKKMKRFTFVFEVLLILRMFMTSSCLAQSELTDEQELAKGADLRVMSYNIMHPDWSRVPVTGRDEIVAEILLYFKPDVVAIQEAGAKWHKALIPLLADTGEYAFACRKSNAEGFIYCTTCFLYDPTTVRLEEEYIQDLDYRDAARVFSVAVFERLSDGIRFAVTNTHPAPRDEPQKYAKNMECILSYASELSSRYPDMPLIMTGDFNTPEHSEMYLRLMKEAGISDAKYKADLMLRDYPTFFGYQVIPNTNEPEHCVDHIFVNDRVDVKLFNAVIDHDVQNASDHIPIYADIHLK